MTAASAASGIAGYGASAGSSTDGQAAAIFDRSQSGGTIGTHTGENDPDRPVSVGLRNRAKKWIGSRAGIVDTGTLIEPNQSRAYQRVMVLGCDVDVAGLVTFSVFAAAALSQVSLSRLAARQQLRAAHT